jgi:hypothetical protein
MSKLQPSAPETTASEPSAAADFAPISPAQLAANRANALHSTGPRTPAGLATSSKNAVKSGLTGRTVLLPSDDREEYAQFLGNFERELAPVGQLECELVQIIVDCHWRLRRIQELEYALYAHGERQFADAFAGEHDARSMIVLQTHLTYQKDLRNLHLQEARIDRKRAKALTELNQLQSLRKQKEEPSASESDSLSEADLFAALDAGYVPSSIAGTLKSQQPVRKDGFVFSDSREQASPSAAEPSDPGIKPVDRAA